MNSALKRFYFCCCVMKTNSKLRQNIRKHILIKMNRTTPVQYSLLPQHTSTCIHTHTRTHTSTHTHAPAHPHTHAQTCTHVHLHIHTHMYTHTHAHTHTDTCTHTHVHTHAHTHTWAASVTGSSVPGLQAPSVILRWGRCSPPVWSAWWLRSF